MRKGRAADVAFAWPAVRSTVHDVPIAVAGPAPAVQQVTAALEQRLPGAFAITAVGTEDAEKLIRNREAYGAIDLTSGTPQVLTASAASSAVAQTLTAVGTALSRSPAEAGIPGAAGQFLPPGAGGSLLRSTAFFDGAAATHPVVVLLSWLAFGALLCAAGALRSGRRPAADATGPAARETTPAPV